MFLFCRCSCRSRWGWPIRFVAKRQREFIVDHSRQGRSRFILGLPMWPVYRIYVRRSWPASLVRRAGRMSWAGRLATAPTATIPHRPASRVVVPSPASYVGVVYCVRPHRLREPGVESHHARRAPLRQPAADPAHAGIYAANIVAIAVTLGLAVPWARVRLARYRAASLTLLPGGPLLSEADAAAAEESATGAELSDAMDLDFGL